MHQKKAQIAVLAVALTIIGALVGFWLMQRPHALTTRSQGAAGPGSATATTAAAVTAELKLAFVDSEGKLVPGVNVRVRLPGGPGNRAIEDRTDDSGKLGISGLPLGKVVVVEVLDEGFATISELDGMILLGGRVTEPRPFVLHAAGSISGRVTYADGTPAARARVSVWPAMTIAGEDGSYRATRLPPGLYRLESSLDARQMELWHAGMKTGVFLEAGQELTGQDLVFVRGGRISGRIIDKSTGEAAGGGHSGFGIGATWTDALGNRIQQVDWNAGRGNYSIRVRPGSYEVGPLNALPEFEMSVAGNRTVSVQEEQNYTLDFEFAPKATEAAGKSVTGRVVNEAGEGVPYALVYAFPAMEGGVLKRKQAGADGRFEFKEMNGKVSLRAALFKQSSTAEGVPAGGGDAVTVKAVDAMPGDDLKLTIKPGMMPAYKGRVVDERGMPLAGISAAVCFAAASERAGNLRHMVMGTAVETGADGRYAVTGGWPDMENGVEFSGPGYGVGWQMDLVRPKPGEVGNVPDFVLRRADGFIGGTVLDESGKPLPGIVVIKAGLAEERTLTNRAGRFRFSRVAELETDVSVQGHALVKGGMGLRKESGENVVVVRVK